MANSLNPYKLTAALLLIGIFFYPGWFEHVKLSNDLYWFNDDTRQQIVPFICVYELPSCQDNYIERYYRSVLPKGYVLLYDLSALWLDPRKLSKLLPYLLIILTFTCVCLVARQLAGGWAALGTLALCLSGYIFAVRMTGGLPRSFGFPLVALMMLGLITNRSYLLAMIPVLGAGLYYPIAVLGGVVLVLHLFFATDAGHWRKRLMVLGGSGLLTIVVLLSSTTALDAFQPSLGPGDEHDYPEITTAGRYNAADSLAVFEKNFFSQSTDTAIQALLRHQGATLRGMDWAGSSGVYTVGTMVLLLIITGWGILAKRLQAARQLLILLAGLLITWLCATGFFPHLLFPQRYLVYTLPLLVVVILPASILVVAQGLMSGQKKFPAALLMGLFISGLILLLGGRGPGKQGLTVHIPSEERPIYEFIHSQEPQVLIAGWPTELVQNIPYLTGRRVLFNQEVHQAYHQPYADEMRRRAKALFTAYLSLTDESLQRLNKEYGVTHLILNQRHFDGLPPRYFEPFDTLIKQFVDSHRQPFATPQKHSYAIVFKHENISVLDLRKLNSDSY